MAIKITSEKRTAALLKLCHTQAILQTLSRESIVSKEKYNWKV